MSRPSFRCWLFGHIPEPVIGHDCRRCGGDIWAEQHFGRPGGTTAHVLAYPATRIARGALPPMESVPPGSVQVCDGDGVVRWAIADDEGEEIHIEEDAR